MNQFVSCIGAISSGKSTFSSNYYKKLFNVRNDYFEISNQSTSFTKGIWMISDQERRKIPNYIFKDILDVEGFQFDENKSWKYVMIIAFLSSELIIFNRNEKYDIVGKIIKTIEKGLKKMEKLYIPRMLKVIYIQTIVKKPKETIEKLLENIKYDKNIFKMIKFKFIYLPNVQKSWGNQDLMNYKDYKNAFEEILNLLREKNNYKSVSILNTAIDNFNSALNENKESYNSQIFRDIEQDFNKTYLRKELEKREELMNKISIFKPLDSLNETFEDYINKQEKLNFEFEIKNDDLIFYGSFKDFDNYYENLKKKKSFKINPKEIFLDIYIKKNKDLKLKSKQVKLIIYFLKRKI